MVHSITQRSTHAPTPTAMPATRSGRRTLRSQLWDREAGRLLFMEDCCALIETQVLSRRGLKAATMRACYRSVQAVKPGTVGYVLGKLIPELLTALEPVYEEASRLADEAGTDAAQAFHDALIAAPDDVVEALLGVTDSRIDSARLAIRIAYRTARQEAQQPVRDAVPALAELLLRSLKEG